MYYGFRHYSNDKWGENVDNFQEYTIFLFKNSLLFFSIFLTKYTVRSIL